MKNPILVKTFNAEELESYTLRDKIAIAAMQALITSNDRLRGDVYALESYKIADAMLKQREI